MKSTKVQTLVAGHALLVYTEHLVGSEDTTRHYDREELSLCVPLEIANTLAPLPYNLPEQI